MGLGVVHGGRHPSHKWPSGFDQSLSGPWQAWLFTQSWGRPVLCWERTNCALIGDICTDVMCTSCLLAWATGTSLIQPMIFPVVFPRLPVLLSSVSLGVQEVRPTWPSSATQMAALSWHRLACSAASWWRLCPSFTNRGSYLLVYLYLFS